MITKEKLETINIEFQIIETQDQFYDAVSACCKLINKGILMSKEDIDQIIHNMIAIQDYRTRRV